ncbi:MAG: hypothetical protein L3K05_08180 [Thermoplasmata archaeon]|nr:hypothetical protein [Thermoplasmata archaeon]
MATTQGADPSERLRRLVDQGRKLEAEGLPFPTDQIRTGVETALAEGDREQALKLLLRAETLYASASRDWSWVYALLKRADEFRDVALRLGLDLEHLDARVGNARDRLKGAPLSQGSLEKAAASASAALAVLNDTIPKFCVQEAQKLGVQIRVAKNRGEDVSEATRAFSKFLRSAQDEHLLATAHQLLEVRRAVARLPRAPTVGGVPASGVAEEEEILLEARKLARRLQRIKGKATDAHSAARLMTQVRAALSEERRYGTPEEEIEALWNEVDRLTKERKSPTKPGPSPVHPLPVTSPAATSPAPALAPPVPPVPEVRPPPGALGDVPPTPTVPPGAAGDLEDAEEDDDEPDGKPPHEGMDGEELDYDAIGPSPLVPPDDVLPSSNRGRNRRTGR